MTFDLLIWLSLIILGFFAVMMLVERASFLHRQKADGVALKRWLLAFESQPFQECTGDYRYVPNGRLGWLRVRYFITCEADGDIFDFHQGLNGYREQVLRFMHWLPTVGTLATAWGLIGTVLALVMQADAAADAMLILGLGMESTLWGILISIVTTIGSTLYGKRVNRILDQVDQVEEAVSRVLSRQYQDRRQPPESITAPASVMVAEPEPASPPAEPEFTAEEIDELLNETPEPEPPGQSPKRPQPRGRKTPKPPRPKQNPPETPAEHD